MVIGKAVVRARDIADRRGVGKTFMRLIEQQGLGRIVNKSTASVLMLIVERPPEDYAWRETLTDRQQVDWAAPTTILKRCPLFAKKPDPAGVGEKPPTKAEQDRQALAEALEENEQLKQRLKRADDGDRFKPTDTADDIATVLVSMFSASKAEDIFWRGLAKLKARKMQKTEA